MAQKTYKQIQEEANRRFGNKPSSEKFEWRKSQQREAGLETEAKKRGGYAGIYDRNKKLVSAAGTGIGFLLGGPAGAAAVRGGIAGLDRPGQSGIGFDVKRGLKGGLEGYGAGSVAALGQAGLANLLGKGAAGAIPALPASAPMVSTPLPSSVVGMGAGVPAAAGAAGAGAAGAVTGAATGVATGAANVAGAAPTTMLGRLLAGAQRNAPIIQAGLGAVSDVMGQRSQQAIEEQRLAQQQQQFEQTFGVSEEERRRRQAEANRLAALFMPQR